MLARGEASTSSIEAGGVQVQQRVPWLPILMYHRIVDRVDGSDPYHLKVSTAEFEAQMKYLSDRGYQSLFLEEVALSTPDDFSRAKPVVITFDDGYRDTYTNALPILLRHQLKATVLLVSGHIGATNTWDGDKAEASPLLGLREIGEMAKHGIRFGSHSVTHRSLPALSSQEAWKEMTESKATLEDMLGSEVRIFSYPYGHSTLKLTEMARQAGYMAACGIEQGEHTLLNLSRVDVASCQGRWLLWRLKLSGIHHRLRQSRSLRKLKAILRDHAGERSQPPNADGDSSGRFLDPACRKR